MRKKLLLVFNLVFVSSLAQETTNVKQYNIIHIMSDDHSFQTISAYGHPISKLAPTPNIDRLAEKGVIFNRAYVENSLSAPSRACLMTGLYSHQNNQKIINSQIDTTCVFFTELLQKNGYQTGLFGKWHLKCEPKGFDSYAILDGQGDYYNPSFKYKGSDDYIKEDGYVTNLITDKAIEFLKNRDRNKHFCLLLHHKAPHRNWMPDIKNFDLYENIEFPYPVTLFDNYESRSDACRYQKMNIEKDMTFIYDLKINKLINEKDYMLEGKNKVWKSIIDSMNDEQRLAWEDYCDRRYQEFKNGSLEGTELVKWKYQKYIQDYLRCIKSIDEQVGRLLDFLESENLMENTIIVYTSDQGFYMGEHGWFDKRFMYEESFRTPLIMYLPNIESSGVINNNLVQNIDFAPTYLDYAGLQPPEFMQGLSLRNLLENNHGDKWRKYLYYHFYDDKGAHKVRKHDGVSDGVYKLIHFYGKDKKNKKLIDDYELYDLKADMNEINNLYGDSIYNEIFNRLKRELDNFRYKLKVDEF